MCISTRSHWLWRQDFLPLNPFFSNVSSQIVVRVVIVVSAKSTTMLTWCLRSQRPRESAVIAQCSYLHFVSFVFCFFAFSIKIKYISARVRVNAYCTSTCSGQWLCRNRVRIIHDYTDTRFLQILSQNRTFSWNRFSLFIRGPERKFWQTQKGVNNLVTLSF